MRTETRDVGNKQTRVLIPETQEELEWLQELGTTKHVKELSSPSTGPTGWTGSCEFVMVCQSPHHITTDTPLKEKPCEN